MLNYIQKLIQIWGNEALKLFIIKIVTCLNLILDAFGMGLKAPLAICVKDEYMARAVICELSGFGSPEMTPLGLPKKEFEDRMAKVDYELFPILCNSVSKKNNENIETACNVMISKKIKGSVFCSLPIVMFCGSIPQDLADHLSGKCVIEGKERNGTANSEETSRNIIEALLDNMPVIEYKLQDLDRGDVDEGFLRGAGEVCKVLIEQEEGVNGNSRSEIIQGIELAVKGLEAVWEIVSDNSIWLDSLRDIILENAKYQLGIVNRKAVSYGDEVVLERLPMYDENFYYFTSDFFGEMCKKIPYVGETEMKRAMYDAGILVGEGVNRIYFEVKVPITTKSGVKATKRRLRIARSWLDLPGGLSWKDLIEMNRRKIK